ncbi:MAG: bifunctional heptose 7-phosphate kinase/heptose 1-phosphate adenyltransferase [Thermogutta sp.]
MRRFGGFDEARLREWLERFPSLRIGVLGDFFLDKYLDVDPALQETSVETGKPAHQVIRVRHSPGAAGTVVGNLSALGVGLIEAVGFTGDDGEAYDLRKGLTALRCATRHLHVVPERMTPTYTKPRDADDLTLRGEHSRYDLKNREPLPEGVLRRIAQSVDYLLPTLDALIVLDQVEEEDCGVITFAMRQFLAERAAIWPSVVFWADSRRRIRRFRGLIAKCNRHELLLGAPAREDAAERNEIAAEPNWDVLLPALRHFREANAAPVVVTLGAFGMLVSDPEPIWVPGVPVTGPVDPTGAGDSASAAAVAALACGASLPEAALLGNLAASITVRQLATTGTARPEELQPGLKLWREAQAGE